MPCVRRQRSLRARRIRRVGEVAVLGRGVEARSGRSRRHAPFRCGRKRVVALASGWSPRRVEHSEGVDVLDRVSAWRNGRKRQPAAEVTLRIASERRSSQRRRTRRRVARRLQAPHAGSDAAWRVVPPHRHGIFRLVGSTCDLVNRASRGSVAPPPGTQAGRRGVDAVGRESATTFPVHHIQVGRRAPRASASGPASLPAASHEHAGQQAVRRLPRQRLRGRWRGTLRFRWAPTAGVPPAGKRKKRTR